MNTLNREYMRYIVFVYMNSVSVENTGNAKYTCGMIVNKIAGSVTSINEQ